MKGHCNYWDTYEHVQAQKKRARAIRERRSMMRQFAVFIGALAIIFGISE